MPSALPYTPDLGSHLRALAQPADHACWLRLDAGRRERFSWSPRAAVVLGKQSDTKDSICNFLYTEDWPSFWSGLEKLLAPRPAAGSGHLSSPLGAALGFIGYGPSPRPDSTFPTAWLGLHDHIVDIDHERRTITFHSSESTTAPTNGTLLLDAALSRAADSAPGAPAFRLQAPFQPLTPPARYRTCFARIQNYLRQGDCYQVNYTQAFHSRCQGSGAVAFEALLAAANPAHAAWMSLPGGEILSLSPELFLRVRDGQVTTRPIKGTAPRSVAAAEDAELRQTLARSEKNRAENLMIVDLLRHDIGRHAETGSVKVEGLFEVESLPQVHHLVSTVTARLRAGATAVDLVRDCFPGGSITGAPKKRAMEIIAELEDTPRSVYCGSIGYIAGNGDVELNIAIRTLLRLDDDIYAWAGGGIVADSDCDAEYQECFHKIGALLRTLEAM